MTARAAARVRPRSTTKEKAMDRASTKETEKARRRIRTGKEAEIPACLTREYLQEEEEETVQSPSLQASDPLTTSWTWNWVLSRWQEESLRSVQLEGLGSVADNGKR